MEGLDAGEFPTCYGSSIKLSRIKIFVLGMNLHARTLTRSRNSVVIGFVTRRRAAFK